jgi:hypothetical protein
VRKAAVEAPGDEQGLAHGMIVWQSAVAEGGHGK